MAELPLAAASRRLRYRDQVERGEILPDEPSFSELDSLPIIGHSNLETDEETRKFIEFSRCFSFSGADAKLLISPLVYVLLRGNRPLYVGMSTLGARRPFDPGHHALRHMQDGDKLLLWPVKNALMAERMERLLIDRLKPALNKQNVTRAIREALGIRQPAP